MTDETANEPEMPSDEGEQEQTAAEETASVPEAADTTDPAELQQKVAELKDQLLRAQAEQENFRRRTQREAGEARKYQSLAVVRDLLPAIDNLQRAVQAGEQTGEVTSLLEGIRMVSQQLQDTLKAHSAQPITAAGEAFDPNLHEALSQVPSPDHPPMTVLQEVETGYRMHDRVVRPAKVIVSCAPPEPANEDSSQEQE